jgi:hypothetical protein
MLMDRFWKEMTAIYLTKWTDDYGVDWQNVSGSISVWYDLLIDVPWKLIEHGIERCKRELEWLPKTAQFIKMCKFEAEDIGAPSFEEAYREACNGGVDVLQGCQGGYTRTIGKEWSHAAVYHAYKSIDGFNFVGDDKKKRGLFESKYNEMVNRIIGGEQLDKPEPILSIDHNPSGVKTDDSYQAARSALDNLKNSLS